MDNSLSASGGHSSAYYYTVPVAHSNTETALPLPDLAISIDLNSQPSNATHFSFPPPPSLEATHATPPSSDSSTTTEITNSTSSNSADPLSSQVTQTLLQFLEAKDADAILNLLTLHNVDVNILIDSETLLMHAARKGFISIVKALLDTPSIDVNITNKEGLTALSLALTQQHEAIAEVLKEYKKAKATQLLLDKGITMNPKFRGEAFITAAQKGETNVILALLETSDFDINRIESYGMPVLSIAASSGSLETVKALLTVKI